MALTTCIKCGRVHNGEGCVRAERAAQRRENVIDASFARLRGCMITPRSRSKTPRMLLVLDGPGGIREYAGANFDEVRAQFLPGIPRIVPCVFTRAGERFSLRTGFGLESRSGWRLATRDEVAAFLRGER